MKLQTEIAELTERIRHAARQHHDDAYPPSSPDFAVASVDPFSARSAPVLLRPPMTATPGSHDPSCETLLAEVGNMIVRAGEKTTVAEEAPRWVRPFLRNQGGYNSIVLRALEGLEQSNRLLMFETVRLRDWMEHATRGFNQMEARVASMERQNEYDQRWLRNLQASDDARGEQGEACRQRLEEQGAQVQQLHDRLEENGASLHDIQRQADEHVGRLLGLQAQADQQGIHTREIQGQAERLGTHLETLQGQANEQGTHTREVHNHLDRMGEHLGQTVRRVDEVHAHADRLGTHLQNLQAQANEQGNHTRAVRGQLGEVGYRLDQALREGAGQPDSRGRTSDYLRLEKMVDRLDERQVNDTSSLKNQLWLLQRRPAARQGEEPPRAEPTEVSADEATDLDALYVAFEDVFRGTRTDIKSRLETYLPHLSRLSPGTNDSWVLDLGCGRGEWLELLGEHSIPASGIDLNTCMIEECRKRGLSATRADALTHLASLPDACVGAVTAFHLIEHLPFDRLFRFLRECRRVLRPGGLAIFETPNPSNLIVGAAQFYDDHTHQRPLPPNSTRFLMEQAGFPRVDILPLHPRETADRVHGDGTNVALVERFNELLYGPQDYAMIAVLPS